MRRRSAVWAVAGAVLVAMLGIGVQTRAQDSDPAPATARAGEVPPLEGCQVPPLSAADPTVASETELPAGTPASSVPGFGTVADPVPFGTAARVDEWTVSVVAVDPDAPRPSAEEIPFLFPTPEPGVRIVHVRLALTNCGTETVDPALSLSWGAVDPQGATYSGLTAMGRCGSLPDDLALVFMIEPGGVTEGTICLLVPAEAIDGLVFSLRSLDAMVAGREPVYFALAPTGDAAASPVASS